jgi:MYXO-CTERM domain-containing protein
MFAAAALSTARALAANDCPPGSTSVTEDGFTWCRPSVCANDGQCRPDEVCRPIPLCLEVGTLADDAARDGGKRLVVTQPCVAGQEPGDPKTCPQKQTCSEMSRCVSKTAADKLGLLSAPSAGGEPPSAAKRSSCGCDAVGADGGSSAGLTLAVAIAALVGRRRRA